MLLFTLSASSVEVFLTASVLSAVAEAAQAPSWARRRSRGRSSEHWLPCAWRRTRQAGLKPLMAHGLSWAIQTRLTSRVLASMKSPWCGGLRVRFGRVAGARGGRHTVNTDCRGIAGLLLLVACGAPRGRRAAASRPASALKWRRVQAADGPAMRV